MRAGSRTSPLLPPSTPTTSCPPRFGVWASASSTSTVEMPRAAASPRNSRRLTRPVRNAAWRSAHRPIVLIALLRSRSAQRPSRDGPGLSLDAGPFEDPIHRLICSTNHLVLGPPRVPPIADDELPRHADVLNVDRAG